MGTVGCKRFLGNLYKYEITHKYSVQENNMKKNSYKYDGINLVGERHGRLVVIEKSQKGRSRWICKCDCGSIKEYATNKFFTYKSCGCLKRENRKKLGSFSLKHSSSDTRLYGVWCGIKDRCQNKNLEHYENYGGRGIKVCDSWSQSFESFKKWAIENGYKEGSTGKEQSIERIDVNGNYEPNNCKWVTQKEQARNKTNTVYIDVRGVKVPLTQFCEEHKIDCIYSVRRRIAKGYSADQILEEWEIKRNKDDYFTPKEAATYYGVTCQSIYDWVKTGKLIAVTTGNPIYIKKGQTVERPKDRNEKGQFLSRKNERIHEKRPC